MTARANYVPGAATGAEVRKNGDEWTLILVRDLRQPPAVVWEALTDPNQLREWAPFDADRNLGATGPVTLATVLAPKPQVSTSTVTRADAPTLLEYGWGENQMRWELKPHGNGTRLTLWHNIDRKYMAMGAAGWHICLDVLDRFLAGEPVGRIVGGDAMKFEWKRLNTEYAAQFGMKPESPPSRTAT
ncbi:MAG: SRPBCC family protein [Gemmatimonadaceae bacterium]